MRKYLSSAVCAAALLLGAASVDVAFAPAFAQDDGSVDFGSFHDQLAPYGDWVYSDRWGEVWIPGDVPPDFHPYGSGGHWDYSDTYGWTWASDYEWGDIPFHYGRWVNDRDDGWLWIPGYVWSPGWVVWRQNGQYTGWMPMPPDDQFLGLQPEGASVDVSIGGLSVDFNNIDDNYGYSRWYGPSYDQNSFAANWFFIGTGHMADGDYGRYRAPPQTYVTLIHNTTNITNYTVVNNYVVNRSVNVQLVERASGHPVTHVQVADIVHKPQLITRADTGRAVQTRMRTQMPRGSGAADSAPKPTPAVVQSLSTNVKAHGGKPPAHLFTRSTVVHAPLPEATGHPATPAQTPMLGARPNHGDRPDDTTMTPASPADNGMHGPTPDSTATPPHASRSPTDDEKSMHRPADDTSGAPRSDRMTPPAKDDTAPPPTTGRHRPVTPPVQRTTPTTPPVTDQAPPPKGAKPAKKPKKPDTDSPQ